MVWSFQATGWCKWEKNQLHKKLIDYKSTDNTGESDKVPCLVYKDDWVEPRVQTGLLYGGCHTGEQVGCGQMKKYEQSAPDRRKAIGKSQVTIIISKFMRVERRSDDHSMLLLQLHKK